MLLFHVISFYKLKCFIVIVAKLFTNIWINIVKKYNFFQFVQVYKCGVLRFYIVKKLLSLISYINCVRIENEFHSLLYSTSKTGMF